MPQQSQLQSEAVAKGLQMTLPPPTVVTVLLAFLRMSKKNSSIKTSGKIRKET
jgi:hypothetical protein